MSRQLDLFVSAEDAARRAGETLRAVMGRLPSSDWLTVADIAEALAMDSAGVYAWIDGGKFEVLNTGAGSKPHYKIHRAGFLKFLETRVQ